MHFRIHVAILADDGTEQQHEIADLLRVETSIEAVGLSLAESKSLLHALQSVMVERQVTAHLEQQGLCPQCSRPMHPQAGGSAPYHTLFGLVIVPNPRWLHCDCQPHATKTYRPLATLLPERTSPELRYLETSWAADASYGSATKHLHDAFPLDQRHNAVTVRNHTLQAARRTEQRLGPEHGLVIEGCQAERESLPIPDGPLFVGLDGGIVRARRNATDTKTSNLFEVIAGKSILSSRRDDPEGVPPSSKCFALVQSFDTQPKRRLFNLLTSQGMQASQQVTFFSDGGNTICRLAVYLHPDAEHILDWFHLTMRITVLLQCARGLARTKAAPVDERTLERRVGSV